MPIPTTLRPHPTDRLPDRHRQSLPRRQLPIQNLRRHDRIAIQHRLPPAQHRPSPSRHQRRRHRCFYPRLPTQTARQKHHSRKPRPKRPRNLSCSHQPSIPRLRLQLKQRHPLRDRRVPRQMKHIKMRSAILRRPIIRHQRLQLLQTPTLLHDQLQLRCLRRRQNPPLLRLKRQRRTPTDRSRRHQQQIQLIRFCHRPNRHRPTLENRANNHHTPIDQKPSLIRQHLPHQLPKPRPHHQHNRTRNPLDRPRQKPLRPIQLPIQPPPRHPIVFRQRRHIIIPLHHPHEIVHLAKIQRSALIHIRIIRKYPQLHRRIRRPFQVQMQKSTHNKTGDVCEDSLIAT